MSSKQRSPHNVHTKVLTSLYILIASYFVSRIISTLKKKRINYISFMIRSQIVEKYNFAMNKLICLTFRFTHTKSFYGIHDRYGNFLR